MLKRGSIVFFTAGFVCLMLSGCSSPTKETTQLTEPTLWTPFNGASFVPDTLALIWNQSADAASYAVQVSSSADFSTLAVSGSSASPNFAIMSPLANNATYYWRVSALNTEKMFAQLTSTWSDTFSFTTGVPAPALSFPLDNELYVPDTLTLSWAASLRATKYYLQLSTDSNFLTFAINDSTTSPSFTITSPLASSTDYFWRVSVVNPQGSSGWSETRSFHTWDSLEAVADSLPVNGAVGVSLPVSLAWTSSTSSWVFSYQVQVSTVSDFSSNIVVDMNVWMATTTDISTLSAGTLYYWRVAAVDILGQQSDWSAAWSFTTQ